MSAPLNPSSGTGTITVSAPQPTTLTVSNPNISVNAGQQFTIQGRLTSQDGRTAIAGARISFWSPPRISPDSALGGTNTDANGNFSFSYTFAWGGNYEVLVRFAGTDQWAESQARAFVTVTAPTGIFNTFPGGTAGTLNLSATSVRPGQTLTISGYLVRTDNNQGQPNQTISISTSPSLFSVQATTGTGGFFSVNVTIPSTATSGTYTITANFAGGTATAGLIVAAGGVSIDLSQLLAGLLMIVLLVVILRALVPKAKARA